MVAISQSKKLGLQSEPFLAPVYAYNPNQRSINDVSSATDLGDLSDLINVPSTIHHIRIEIPNQIRRFTALHFEIKFTCASDQSLVVMKLALAKQQINFANPTYVESEINRQTDYLGGNWQFNNGQTIDLNLDLFPLVDPIIDYENDIYFFLSIFFNKEPSAWQAFEKFWLRASGDLPEAFL
jgi:hypothetical protein